MAKEQKREISVVTIFDGKKDGRQAFIELILHRRRAASSKSQIDAAASEKYNQDKVFSDVRVG
jgi:hypothetical protein